jgi:hypothetical protein
MAGIINSRGERALEVAIKAFGSTERNAAVVLFFAAARRLARTVEPETAAELAYMAADDMVKGPKE